MYQNVIEQGCTQLRRVVDVCVCHGNATRQAVRRERPVLYIAFNALVVFKRMAVYMCLKIPSNNKDTYIINISI